MLAEVMNVAGEYWPAARIIHLAGGCLAFNNPNPLVTIEPDTIQNTQVSFRSNKYNGTYGELEKMGFQVIGVDFYTDELEAKGIVPAEWRSYFQVSKNVYKPIESVSEVWGDICHGAFSVKNGRVWDIASRVSYQIELCSWRLRLISDAYNQQLLSAINKGFEDERRFEDLVTRTVYAAIHSFVIDASILRDYLCEFTAQFVFGPKFQIDANGVTAVGSFMRKILKEIQDDDAFVEEFKKITSKDGWLKRLGDYRDSIVHSAPLSHRTHRSLVTLKLLKVNENQEMPVISVPLVKEPHELNQARLDIQRSGDFDEHFGLLIRLISGDVATVDGLEYCKYALDELALLADKISKESPIAPKKMEITEDDFRGDLEFS